MAGVRQGKHTRRQAAETIARQRDGLSFSNNTHACCCVFDEQICSCLLRAGSRGGPLHARAFRCDRVRTDRDRRRRLRRPPSQQLKKSIERKIFFLRHKTLEYLLLFLRCAWFRFLLGARHHYACATECRTATHKIRNKRWRKDTVSSPSAKIVIILMNCLPDSVGFVMRVSGAKRHRNIFEMRINKEVLDRHSVGQCVLRTQCVGECGNRRRYLRSLLDAAYHPFRQISNASQRSLRHSSQQ
jgi:hypothetical protein